MEEDQVNRRDAVVGLGLLGGLTVLLVATIFYRIINPTPPHKIVIDENMIAVESTDAAEPYAVQSPALPGAAPVQQDGAVSAAAFGSEQSTQVDQPQPAPTFVSPSSVLGGTP
jgi:hypothetical protein